MAGIGGPEILQFTPALPGLWGLWLFFRPFFVSTLSIRDHILDSFSEVSDASRIYFGFYLPGVWLRLFFVRRTISMFSAVHPVPAAGRRDEFFES